MSTIAPSNAIPPAPMSVLGPPEPPVRLGTWLVFLHKDRLWGWHVPQVGWLAVDLDGAPHYDTEDRENLCLPASGEWVEIGSSRYWELAVEVIITLAGQYFSAHLFAAADSLAWDGDQSRIYFNRVMGRIMTAAKDPLVSEGAPQ